MSEQPLETSAESFLFLGFPRRVSRKGKGGCEDLGRAHDKVTYTEPNKIYLVNERGIFEVEECDASGFTAAEIRYNSQEYLRILKWLGAVTYSGKSRQPPSRNIRIDPKAKAVMSQQQVLEYFSRRD